MAPAPSGRVASLEGLVSGAAAVLADAHEAREAALGRCRQVIRLAGRAIRAIHRLDTEMADRLISESHQQLRAAQSAVAGQPAVAHAGFLHDAEKEYAEAVLTRALVGEGTLPGPDELAVGVPAWLNGLAEAASELRRHLLDRLRAGEAERAERLLSAMDAVYDQLMMVDYPDAITGGLRRSTDALRAVLERSRSDLTSTLIQARLQQAVEARVPPAS